MLGSWPCCTTPRLRRVAALPQVRRPNTSPQSVAANESSAPRGCLHLSLNQITARLTVACHSCGEANLWPASKHPAVHHRCHASLCKWAGGWCMWLAHSVSALPRPWACLPNQMIPVLPMATDLGPLWCNFRRLRLPLLCYCYHWRMQDENQGGLKQWRCWFAWRFNGDLMFLLQCF
jgi:hypothetical protein